MLDMLVLDDHGRAVGSSFGQLAFSHTYGYGMEDSCENTRKAVSDFLGGITINYYVALNLDAITILNDAVGGVTVNVTDDFSQVYSTLQMGELTLKGSQASSYIRSHSGTDGQLNRTAVSRQEQYMYGFVTALKEKSKQDISSMARLYDEIRDYAVTDCTVSDLNRLMNDYSDYSVEAVLTLEGDRIPGGEYHEFHVDEKALDDLILRLFYAEKQDCQIIE